jgi:coenzyme F420-reducing hydrogenase alpha subunit
MAETKEELIQTIREWVKIDNEIQQLQKEVAIRKKEKMKISSQLMDIMKKNEIDCFDLKDGQILYSKKNIKKPITKKILNDVLVKFYKGDYMKATELNDFIMQNRGEMTKETIIRKINKEDIESTS